VSGLGLVWPLIMRPAGKGVSPAEATRLINRENALVLDVREPDEFAAGHIPDAINIPVAKLAERIQELDKFRSRPLVVCCLSGMRAGRACSELKKQGFEQLNNLSGGIDAWIGANYPVKKGAKSR
ncbi:MAG: rhodanese-like domain-containing protein, partial [Azonexus sp.]|nr:rhodanese-like domain-containing protein [Azonexus sp.]